MLIASIISLPCRPKSALDRRLDLRRRLRRDRPCQLGHADHALRDAAVLPEDLLRASEFLPKCSDIRGQVRKFLSLRILVDQLFLPSFTKRDRARFF